MTPFKIPSEVANQLGYYVYLYVDPRSGKPFYVGKGKSERVFSHLSAHWESKKDEVISELHSLGLEPRLDILAHGLPDEETALRIEAAIIDLLGIDELTNEVRGWRSIQLGRVTLSELITYYAAEHVDIVDPVLLIRINNLYRRGMSDLELYEATRGVWKLGTRREKARLAFAVFESVVREVFEIQSWHPAGTLPYRTRNDAQGSGRWEFEGEVAGAAIRNRYTGKSVERHFARHSQNPIRYVNC